MWNSTIEFVFNPRGRKGSREGSIIPVHQGRLLLREAIIIKQGIRRRGRSQVQIVLKEKEKWSYPDWATPRHALGPPSHSCPGFDSTVLPTSFSTSPWVSLSRSSTELLFFMGPLQDLSTDSCHYSGVRNMLLYSLYVVLQLWGPACFITGAILTCLPLLFSCKAPWPQQKTTSLELSFWNDMQNNQTRRCQETCTQQTNNRRFLKAQWPKINPYSLCQEPQRWSPQW